MNVKIVPITKIAQLIDEWPIFRQGLEELTSSARCDFDEQALFGMASHVIRLWPKQGLVALLKSKRGVPLGWGIAFENTEPYCRRSAVVYAAYTTNQSPGTLKVLLNYAEKWAREQGIQDLQACSRRFSRAAFRLFERGWKFQRVCVVFRKEL